MAFTDYINVTYDVFSTSYSIKNALNSLSSYSLLSFDTESRSVYTKEERKEAKQLLKAPEDLTHEDRILLKQVQESSGLSYPSLVKCTHIQFGISETHSYVFICYDAHTEVMVFNWLVAHPETKFIVHNAMHDFKLALHRTNTIPTNFFDTQLAIRTLTNHSEVWKAKAGLKDLMGTYYHPEWAVDTDYEVANLKDKNFLRYAAIDTCATYKLYNLIQEQIND